MKLKIPFVIFILWTETNLFAAEAGMPPAGLKVLVFAILLVNFNFLVLYLSLSKFFIPKIKDNLDDREKKINENLDEAKKFSELAEEKKFRLRK